MTADISVWIGALITGAGAAAFMDVAAELRSIAASRTPDPASARRRSVVAHAIYGVGLYAGGWLAALALA